MTIENAAPSPRGRYTSVTTWKNIALVAGHVGRQDGQAVRGRLDGERDIPAGQFAARLAADACLRALQAELGGLDKVVRILSVRGFIATTSSFEHHTQVLDAASEYILEHLPGRGSHARAVVGVTSLPSGGLVEIEMMCGLGG